MFEKKLELVAGWTAAAQKFGASMLTADNFYKLDPFFTQSPCTGNTDFAREAIKKALNEYVCRWDNVKRPIEQAVQMGQAYPSGISAGDRNLQQWQMFFTAYTTAKAQHYESILPVARPPLPCNDCPCRYRNTPDAIVKNPNTLLPSDPGAVNAWIKNQQQEYKDTDYVLAEGWLKGMLLRCPVAVAREQDLRKSLRFYYDKHVNPGSFLVDLVLSPETDDIKAVREILQSYGCWEECKSLFRPTACTNTKEQTIEEKTGFTGIYFNHSNIPGMTLCM